MVRPLETDQLAAKAHRERGEWARKEEQNKFQEKTMTRQTMKIR